MFNLDKCFFAYVCIFTKYVVTTMYSFEMAATSILLSHFCDVS